MNRKILFMSIGLILALAAMLIAASGEKRGDYATADIDGAKLQMETSRAACQMFKFDGGTTSISYYTGYVNGDGTVIYFDPSDPTTNGCNAPSPYPFEITSLTFTLWDWAPGTVQWPVTLDIVVYDVDQATGDPCLGPPAPGNAKCIVTVTCDEQTFSNKFGTVSFPTPCCVDAPFFIGFHYNDAGSGPFPSVTFDNSPTAPVPADCDIWDYWGGSWKEWYSSWNPPVPGYPLFVVDGNTNSGHCATWTHHKMHFPQLPDEDGWDVHVDYPELLADDWQCSETGPITDIHFWGSWLGGQTGVIDHFLITFWSDVAAAPPEIPYSHPGQLVQELYIPQGAFVETPITPSDIALWEGWYDPSVPTTLYNDHQQYWQYDIILPEQDWFYQVQGTIYWINIQAVLAQTPTPTYWGWKSTENHFNDDACYWNGLEWVEIYEPAEVLSNWFEIQLDPTGQWAGGYGVGAYIDPLDPTRNGWYLYPEALEPWWNIWFFDHPLDINRIKDIWIEYSVRPLVEGIPIYAEVTPNWATDIWTLEGMPEGENRPPMPWDFVGGIPPEATWIGRGDPPNIHGQPGDARYDLRVDGYNPEWVSVDVRGTNVWVEGTIYHTCRGSLDLAFVLTSDYNPPPTGACCYADPTGLGTILCAVTTQTDCEGNLGGTYQGDGTLCGGTIEACCLPDGSCVMADIFCCTNELGGTPQIDWVCTTPEACCMPDGSCQMLDPVCCTDMGGTPEGQGTQCTALEACCMSDGSCQMLDPLCCVDLGGTPQGQGTVCTALEACCFNDGSCQDLDPLCCDDLGGTPQGVGTNCATTICEVIPETPKNWYQPPDLTLNGMDVLATHPRMVLADDFNCTKTEPITEIHIWGSWLNDLFPGDPGNVTFSLSLHTDIPAGIMQPWSQPGEMLRQWVFTPGQFIYKEVRLAGTHEGWYDPMGAWLPIGDTKCFEYIFTFDASEWFVQQGSEQAPVIYWLDVQAIVPDQVALFGWKTSVTHWNDDAVWFEGEDIPQIHPWMELRYPPSHPYEGASIDLAFLIGGPCDCVPGETDNLPPINILDIVRLINYKYKGGPAPIPYALCSGDATCNCVVDILDIVFLINYKYKNGPEPCTCANFIANCPGGLRE